MPSQARNSSRCNPPRRVTRRLAPYEAIVSVNEQLQNLGGIRFRPARRGGALTEQDAIAQRKLAFETEEADLEIMDGGGLLVELSNQLQDVRVQILRVAGIDDEMAAVGKALQ